MVLALLPLRLSALFVFIVSPAAAQVLVKGQLLDERSRAPIAFGNIGILNTSVGTISNSDGSYELDIPAGHDRDSVLFSALGYHRRSVAVADIGPGPLVISLDESPTLLSNVTVESRKAGPQRAVTAGNEFHDFGSLYFDSTAAGSAMALLIDLSSSPVHPPFRVRRARLYIAYNTFDRFNVRVRFLEVDSATGAPGRDLVNENTIASGAMRKGWLSFDMGPRNIAFRQRKFYVAFEWLLEDADRELLTQQYREFRRLFPNSVSVDTATVQGERVAYQRYTGFRTGTSFGSSSLPAVLRQHECYYRRNSYGRWRRASAVMSATLTIAGSPVP